MKRLGITARMLVAAAVVAVLVAVTLAVLLDANAGQRDALHRSQDAQAAIAQAGILQNDVLDLGSAVRGYVLTGDAAQLEAWERARDAVEPSADLLLALVAREQVGLRLRAETIAREVSAYRREYADPLIALARRDRDAAGATSFQLDARARSTRIRALLTEFVADERATSQRATAEAQDAGDLARILAVIALVVGVLTVIGMALYLARAIVAPTRRLAGQLAAVGEGDLSARASGGAGELGALSDAFNRMAERIEHGQHEIERRRAEAESQNVELESQNVELATQQAELERALAYLGIEKSRVEAFYGFGARIAQETDLERLAELTLQQLCTLGGCPVGVLYVAADDAQDGDPMEAVALRGLADDERPRPLAPGSGLAGQALRERAPVQADYPELPLQVTVLGRPVAVHHELHVPLVHGDRALGLVSLARLQDAPLTADEIGSITHLAGQAAVAFSNLLAARGTQRQASISQALFAATPVGIALTDEDGQLLLLNERMEALLGDLGVPITANLGAALAELVPQIAAPGTLPGQGEALAADPGARGKGEFSLESTGRSYEWVVGGVQGRDGGLIGRVLVLREVTAERESERLREQFVALVSHELRTPMTSVLGYIQLVLEDDELSEDNADLLEVAARNAQRLVRLIGDLILVSQARSGRLSIHSERLDLRQLANESAEGARPLAGEKRVSLRVIGADEPLPVSGDAIRLRQVIDNLVANAVKFSPEGGEVEVELGRDGGDAYVAVTDSGPGIAEEDQPRLFEPFFRASATAAVTGSGLGLAVVRAIVEAHQGRVAIRPSPRGASFVVHLPSVQDALAGSGARAAR